MDDGSSDATAARAEEAGRRPRPRPARPPPPEEPRQGRRRPRRLPRGRGTRSSSCRTPTSRRPIYEWEKLAAAGAPVAIGSRAVDESLVKERQSLFRQAMGKLFNRLVRLVAVPGIRDTQCGFKLFSREAAREIFSRAQVDRFAYDVEALLLARQLGYAIAEVPVLWFNSPDSRVTLFGGAQAYLGTSSGSACATAAPESAERTASVERERRRQLPDLRLDARLDGGVLRRVEHLADPAGDRLHLGLAHAARRDGGRPDAQARRDERRIRVERESCSCSR